MGFRVYCDNKGCREEQEPLLDETTNEALCAVCGKDIKNMSVFAKRQLKSFGQVKKTVSRQEAFAVNCTSCKKSAAPLVNGNDFSCSFCGTALNLSIHFKQIFKNK